MASLARPGGQTLHTSVHMRARACTSLGSNFRMSNPVIGPNGPYEWRDPDLVRIDDATIQVAVDLDWVVDLLKGYPGPSAESPLLLRFKHILICGLTYNMILSATGELNMVAMGSASQLALSTRQDTSGPSSHLCYALPAPCIPCSPSARSVDTARVPQSAWRITR